MADELLWSLEEAARQLGGVSTRTVRRLIDSGDLTAVKVGRRITIPADVAREWVAKRCLLYTSPSPRD